MNGIITAMASLPGAKWNGCRENGKKTFDGFDVNKDSGIKAGISFANIQIVQVFFREMTHHAVYARSGGWVYIRILAFGQTIVFECRGNQRLRVRATVFHLFEVQVRAIREVSKYSLHTFSPYKKSLSLSKLDLSLTAKRGLGA